MEKKTDKNEKLRDAAEEFAEKVHKLSSAIEIAIVGSVAGGDPYPNDLDLVVIVCNLDDITSIAKFARQMSRYYHGWKVFLFDEDLRLIGRICHRKECPGKSIECYVRGCGHPRYLRIEPDFEYDEKTFLESPIDVLWISFGMSRLHTRKDELGIVESRSYPVLNDIEIECILCGKTFIFTGGEQKWYQKREFSQPKRCLKCREQMQMDYL